jgi:hypothetical protein
VSGSGAALGDILNRPSASGQHTAGDYLDNRFGFDHDNNMEVILDDQDVARQPQVIISSAALPSDTVYWEVDFPDGPDLSWDPDDCASIVPWAYSDGEPSCIQIAYLQVVINNVIGNMPIKQTTDNLNWTLNALDAAGALPVYPRPVRMLISAKKHPGIDPDQCFVQYAICPHCWKHHSPKELLALRTPSCSVPGCSGIIYTEKEDGKGQLKCIPYKIVPHVSFLDSICCMVCCKGFCKLVQDS